MRLGVLDVGSNTVHLLVVDARQGAPPLPAYSHKVELRLAEHLDDAGEVTEDGADRLVEAVRGAVTVSEDMGCASLLTFATSAIREAANGDRVLELVRERTGVELRVLSGDAEARLTFLAVRRWYGWSSRRLLVLDIGGGSLEVATGQDEEPDEATSLPLGAGRLTRDRLVGDPPPAEQVRELRKYVRAEIASSAGQLLRLGPADHFVGTSKTFRTLARICGAAPSADGPYVTRSMTRAALGEWLPKLAEMTAEERRELPGVSHARAAQLVAGGVVAEATMDLYDIDQLEICPWALREGVILRHLDTLATEGM